jgi:hypothetical protein
MLRPTVSQSASLSWFEAQPGAQGQNFVTVRQLRVCSYAAPFLTRGLICPLQLLLVLASTLIPRSLSCGTHDSILMSQIRDSSNLEGQVPVFIFPRNKVAQLYSQVLVFLYIAYYGSQGCRGSLRTAFTRASQSQSQSQSQSHIATDCQSISKSWCRAPSGAHDHICIYYSLTVTVLFFWGALFDERTGLSFIYATGPRQHSRSRVRAPLDSWRYFIISDLRLPFRRLLRLAGSRWRYSNPPPHGLRASHLSGTHHIDSGRTSGTSIGYVT